MSALGLLSSSRLRARGRTASITQTCLHLTICFFILDNSGQSADSCFDTEQHACLHPAAFPIPFHHCTHKMPSTCCVYTFFISNLVLAKFKAAGKTSRQTCWYWLHIPQTRCNHYETVHIMYQPSSPLISMTQQWFYLLFSIAVR